MCFDTHKCFDKSMFFLNAVYYMFFSLLCDIGVPRGQTLRWPYKEKSLIVGHQPAEFNGQKHYGSKGVEDQDIIRLVKSVITVLDKNTWDIILVIPILPMHV